ncbi:MAG: hypothetical protein EBS48_11655 [Actinobacteria bacterium]|nr:hypothetical protein [Actinomycetota bacterium]
MAVNTSASASISCGTSSGSVWMSTSQNVNAIDSGITRVRKRACMGGRWSLSAGSGTTPIEPASTSIRLVS